MHVALATYRKLPNLSADDQLLVPELLRLGIVAHPHVWDEAGVPWHVADLVVIRSCWDYHLRLDEFLTWIAALEARGTRVEHGTAIVRANADKRYLLDLARRGFSVIPTRIVPRGTVVGPGDLVFGNARRLVFKPSVSATAYRTWTAAAGDPANVPRAVEVLQDADLLIQPFVDAIARDGEWALAFFDGCFSHAWTKHAARGEFRVQEEYGGEAVARRAPDWMIAAAQEVLDASAPGALYARIDGYVDGRTLVVSEVELIEPSLRLDLDHSAPRRFAEAIRARVARR
jgi:hypothetical protein